MNLFGSEPQEQAMQTLIHDTRSSTASIEHVLKKMSEWLNENAKAMADAGIKNTSVPFVIVEFLKRDSKNITSAIDCYYEKFKNDFKIKEENK